MLQIGNGKESRVMEDRGREIEGYTMLAQIRGCLDFVPLELKLLVIQN